MWGAPFFRGSSHLLAVRLAVLLIAVALATALGGCGSGDSSTSVASVPAGHTASGLDKSIYLRRAEAICRRGVAKIRNLGRRLPEIVSTAPSPQQGITSGLVGPGIAILSAEAASLRKLGAPPPPRRSKPT